MDETPSSPVAVTGASGFMASWVVTYLLQTGATVHATVRDPTDRRRVSHLDQLATAYPGKLRIFEANLLAPGSFVAAITGCRTVIHTASPFLTGRVRDSRNNLIRPAIEGTRNVLDSVNQSDTVRRVVTTSSVVALYGDATEVETVPKGRFDERRWNTTATDRYLPYPYSKTEAEREAWRVHDAQQRWSLATVLPGFMIGPAVSDRADASSTDLIAQMLDGRGKAGVPDLRFGTVDVRDVARAHVELARRPDHCGRFIVSSEVHGLPDLARLLAGMHPELAVIPKKALPAAKLYLGGPFMGLSWRFLRNNLGKNVAFDNTRSTAELGIHYSPVDTALAEMADQLLARRSATHATPTAS